MPDVSWHILRHNFISRLVMQGVPLKVVQELAGHKSIKITEKYAHLAPGLKNSALEGLANFKEPNSIKRQTPKGKILKMA